MKTEFTKEETTELFEAAKSLNKTKPWKWLSETDVFGIKFPDQEDIIFCSIVGNNGDVYGMELYEGPAGIDSYFKLMSKSYDLDDEKTHISKAYKVSFEDRKLISKEDYELIKLSEVVFRGKNQWPKFSYWEPGYVARGLSKEELALMTKTLKAVEEACLYLKDNLERAKLVKKNKCYVREYKPDNSFKELVVDLYEDVYGDFNKGRKFPRAFNDFDLKRLCNISNVTTSTWEIDYFYSLIHVEGEKPYYPAILIIADANKGVIIGSHMTHPENMMEEFQNHILSFIDKNKELPNQVTMSNVDLLMSMEEMLKGLNITLRPVKKLKLVPMIKEDYHKLLVDKKLV